VDLNYELVNLFPSSVHIFNINGFDEVRNKLIDYVYEYKKNDPDGNIISNRGGWQSKDFSVRKEDDILHSLIINCLASFPYIKESYNIFADAWININPTGSYNNKHNHPSSDLAGVLWIKCPKDCGEIVFDNPCGFETFKTINAYEDKFKNDNKIHHTYFFPPVEGRVLIFPSHLDHNVRENKSKEDRISVSFNIRLQDG
tara:strand:+ start:33 stop:632 length:600 start_codon:yes stop_codon:yes gene_type:complete